MIENFEMSISIRKIAFVANSFLFLSPADNVVFQQQVCACVVMAHHSVINSRSFSAGLANRRNFVSWSSSLSYQKLLNTQLFPRNKFPRFSIAFVRSCVCVRVKSPSLSCLFTSHLTPGWLISDYFNWTGCVNQKRGCLIVCNTVDG